MHTRVQVSTDVAALGIWDRAQPDPAQTPTLEQLAQRGAACIIHVGADCSGAVDVFIDESIPAELLAESTAIADERTVVVRSGEVVIDGVEYFAAGASTARATSSVRLANGTYRAQIRMGKNPDELPEPSSEKEIRRIIGPEEVAYYDKRNKNGLLIGLSTLLILPVLLFFMRWFVAVPVTLGVFLAYFWVLQWALKRNPRYQKVADRIVRLRIAGERPILVIQLSK
jgi:hypothetical protein